MYVLPNFRAALGGRGIGADIRPSVHSRERRLRFYGHVVRFPEDDPAHRIPKSKDPAGWNRRRGCPRVSWLSQLENYMEGWSMGSASYRKEKI